MIFVVLIFMVTVFAAVRTISYGRWAGKQGNSRGALGLYLLAMLTIIIPMAVYILNRLR